MKISVVIPAFNEEKLLARSLASVAEASRAFASLGWENETVVCDNNSTDRTAEIARAAGAAVVFEPRNQIARARNAGASAATGDWLVFIDADSFPSLELFADLAAAIGTQKYLGGGSTVRFHDYNGRASRWVWVWNTISRLTHWAAGSFVFCQAHAFRELGGFSLELYVSEEIEFSRRLKRLARARGKRLIILDQHPLATSPRKLELYAPREHLAFLWRCVRSVGGARRHQAACSIWYDGRR